MFRTTLCAGAALGALLAGPAMAQQTAAAPPPPAPVRAQAADQAIPDVIVSARRTDERLQEVPISITVLSPQQLENANIVNAGDLATYTPSLQADQRFGPENTSFAIRGFQQDAETSPSVGVYFADVPALRGAANGITGGDGAGPGTLFDLQNVEVLKGPQGTLFGRNTTGGDVLLVPKKPTGRFEGYLEVSGGNYNMNRVQGVINIPINDRIRFRGGVDYMDRDGYMENTTGVGPKDFNNIHYVAVRASVVVDVARDVENYSIFSYSYSDNNGLLPHVFECAQTGASAGFSSTFLCPSLAGKPGWSTDSLGNLTQGKNNFYKGTNNLTNPDVMNEQMQLINTTTWSIADNLTIKNIASYGQFHTNYRNNLFGDNSTVPGFFGPAGGTPFILVNSNPVPGSISGAEQTATEELQFQGRAFNDALTWQAGGYFADSLPIGPSDAFAAQFLNCSPTINFSTCYNPLPGILPGNINERIARQTFLNLAEYAQGTYKLTNQLKLTGGIRYTVDLTKAKALQVLYNEDSTGHVADVNPICIATPSGVPAPAAGGNINNCNQSLRQLSHAPTWLIDLDYTPIDRLLLYAKYSRGYRQGSINAFGPSGFQTFNQEKVDAYETGLKTSFGGFIPGTFNLAGFYNSLNNQQIQYVFEPAPGSPVSANANVVNVGASQIWGVEVESTLKPFQGFTVDFGYTYLNTELRSAPTINLPAGSVFGFASPSALVGGPLALSPKDKAVITATYVLPLDPGLGKIAVAGTMSYTGSQIIFPAGGAFPDPYGKLPPVTLFNANLNWTGMFGSKIDGSIFVTNLAGKKYYTYLSGGYLAYGFESGEVGEPRMFGVRLRYRFGD